MSAKPKSQHRQEVLVRQAAALRHFLYGTDKSLVLCPLCLHLWEEEFLSAEKTLTIEDAPPVQYGTAKAQRCITCHECNTIRAGQKFENRVGLLNKEREAALETAHRAPSRQPSGLWTPPREAAVAQSVDAFRLASLCSDERQLELKSAYVIAFAALGHSYVLSHGLEAVRQLIDPGADLSTVDVCGRLTGLPPGLMVRVALKPIECVVVSHPTYHRSRDRDHVVFLPVPDSPPNFYDQLRWLRPQATWTFYRQYRYPPARRLPMAWDHGDWFNPLRSGDTWQVDRGCPPEEDHEPIEIRLAQPRQFAGCGTSIG